ncbi:cysteine hydrolase family protein [Terribacillus saccharophilus]|uniref:cysteine hydrolase family protein n=1 Tax=Terribacillus saccharophilus TaxID=361277 RepID=UPI000BA6DC18|nr:isochorismatase family cysteine hydrolase [Terribacillus saccharophilus]PAF17043.1 isochorismatase [Terribacillus saccharophilus]PAF21112.1 isochorismatase [Terribacillus saccharophilus]
MKALINIDYTNDFVAEDGALTCGVPGREIEERLTAITSEFIENGDYVVFAIDKHEEKDAYHPETKLYPPHNIDGTEGRALYGKLSDAYESAKHELNVYYMDKTRYSAFAGTDLLQRLNERGIKEIHAVGVATDICVFHTLVDAYNYGFNIVVHSDAVASFNQEGHAYALHHFKSALGAEITEGGAER